MNLHFLHSTITDLNDEQDKHAVTLQEHPHDITEGGEFLDDAIRMKEQPFMYAYTEENVASGISKGLWY